MVTKREILKWLDNKESEVRKKIWDDYEKASDAESAKVRRHVSNTWQGWVLTSLSLRPNQSPHPLLK